ncbi:Methyltransferase-like protein 2-A [Galdieria sulphuraria]|uniref:tRNA N(3)-methylcytidine methyltransferase n=1 Tax=Galdieria sulphuraria TaxID=130081 RepID=M2XQI7_GALSU|nr:trans-aconitate 2-methyltransferase [Galdieria sulphuraria]EME32507.1 trans-aconitate 2-methyltransferase [Galdieria sulphuraria]GJD08097.1 Methyltransferase-like protein 2-A [Galdieria sulphuraria]|eukprot:XP_005709027.1 trans-aconitate 2-methyltransferase [Galdieria sulphuraria]
MSFQNYSSRSLKALSIAQLESDEIAEYLESHSQQGTLQTITTRKDWNHFYSTKQNKFFKNRYNLRYFFPELLPAGVEPKTWHPPVQLQGQKCVEPPTVEELRLCRYTIVLEVGCGVGNSIFPLIRANPNLFVFGIDFSEEAIRLLRDNVEYDCRRVYAFVADAAEDEQKIYQIIPPHSIDYITLFWTLSAQSPEDMKYTVKLAQNLLKPGTGKVLFRDYAFGDLAQIRQHPKNCVDRNLYLRGDGTLAYYFTESFLQSLFPSSHWETLELVTHTKAVVNRKENKNMTRRWLQAKFLLVSDQTIQQ